MLTEKVFFEGNVATDKGDETGDVGVDVSDMTSVSSTNESFSPIGKEDARLFEDKEVVSPRRPD